MSSKKNLYEILGLDRASTEDEIKRAFRRTAGLHHPDRNPGDPQAATRFKEANNAYQVLVDPQKRRAYDLTQAAADPSSGWPSSQQIVNEILNSFFRNAGVSASPIRDRVDAYRRQQRVQGARPTYIHIDEVAAKPIQTNNVGFKVVTPLLVDTMWESGATFRGEHPRMPGVDVTVFVPSAMIAHLVTKDPEPGHSYSVNHDTVRCSREKYPTVVELVIRMAWVRSMGLDNILEGEHVPIP